MRWKLRRKAKRVVGFLTRHLPESLPRPRPILDAVGAGSLGGGASGIPLLASPSASASTSSHHVSNGLARMLIGARAGGPRGDTVIIRSEDAGRLPFINSAL